MHKAEIIAKVTEVITAANAMFRLNMDIPEISFFDSGRVAGRAYPLAHKLAFNTILSETNPDTFHETIIHEVAHLVTRKVRPLAKQAHGPEFKQIDKLLGGRGTRCHNYDVSTVPTKERRKVRYECKCNCTGSHFVTRKTASMASLYRCKTCKSTLVYTGNKATWMPN